MRKPFTCSTVLAPRGRLEIALEGLMAAATRNSWPSGTIAVPFQPPKLL
jgi:hypothetical protein